MANDIYSKGNVLINNLNITDEDTLKQAEVDFATVRIYEVLVIIVEKLRHSNIEGIEKLYESFEYECNKVEESLSKVEIEM